MTITGFTPADTAFSWCQVSAPCGVASSVYPLLEYCPADFNCDGGVDGDDILTFFTAWENGGC